MSPDPERTQTSSLAAVRPGRYIDFEPAGEGGMGLVYWALDTDLNRQVAFKVVRPDAATGESPVPPASPTALTPPDADTPASEAFHLLTARFLQEAWVTGGLEHPGIVPVYELGRTEQGIPYYTMRFVRGERTLAAALAEAESLEARLKLLEPLLRVCDTMEYAHAQGVVHRDLKPGNVALGTYGEVVVLDWGLARLTDGEEASAEAWRERVQAFRDVGEFGTEPGPMGTPGYMSPEAALGRLDEVGVVSDVYSLGAMLFEVLTGELPHPVRSYREYLDALVAGDAPSPQARCPQAPVGLAEVCSRAIAHEPRNRFQSAASLAEAIRSWQADRAREIELKLRTRDVQARLDVAASFEGDARLRELDGALTALAQVETLGGEGATEAGLRAELERLRVLGLGERERAGRRRLVARLGVGLLAASIVVAAIVGKALDDRRAEAERARTAAAEGRRDAEEVLTFLLTEVNSNVLANPQLTQRIGEKAHQYYAKTVHDPASRAETLNRILMFESLGRAMAVNQDFQGARKSYQLAYEMAERASQRFPEAGDIRLHIPEGLNYLAAMHAMDGNMAEAEEIWLRSVEVARRLQADFPDDADVRRWLGHALFQAGRVASSRGDRKTAAHHLEASLDVFRSLPKNLSSGPNLLETVQAVYDEVVNEAKAAPPPSAAVALRKALSLSHEEPMKSIEHFVRAFEEEDLALPDMLAVAAGAAGRAADLSDGEASAALRLRALEWLRAARTAWEQRIDRARTGGLHDAGLSELEGAFAAWCARLREAGASFGTLRNSVAFKDLVRAPSPSPK